MDYLNLHQLQALCSPYSHEELCLALEAGQSREGIQIWSGQQEKSLIEQAQKLSSRECWKLHSTKKDKDSQGPERWMFGEFKIFVAVALLLAHAKKSTLELLTKEDVETLHSIFPLKSFHFVRYELTCLIHVHKKSRKHWEDEEQALLKRIVGQPNGEIQWRSVSMRLYKQSDEAYFRLQKDCREKWRNYLNPKVIKKEWTEEEDAKLMKLVEHYGSRWSFIARKFQGTRTEHMVKNRYNSFIKAWRTRQPQKPRIIKRGKATTKEGQTRGRVKKEAESGISEMQMEMEEDIIVQEQSGEQIEPSRPALVETAPNNPKPGKIQEKVQAAVFVSIPEPQKQLQDLLCAQFIQQRLFQAPTSNPYDKYLKRTNDEDDLSGNTDPQIIPWPTDNHSLPGVFTMQRELQQAAMNEVAALLGCSHFEAMLQSYHPSQEDAGFDWLSD